MSRLFNWLKSRQKKPESRSASTLTNTGNSASQPEEKSSSGSSPLTCKNLPLYHFKEAYYCKNFDPLFLLIPGTQEQKEWRWKVILEEFSFLMKNEEGDHLFELAKKIYILRTQITAVDYCCFYLNIRYDKEVADKLCEVYPMDYSVKSNIQRALTMVDTKRYELGILSEEYSRLHETNKGEEPTEKDYQSIKVKLNKHQGFKINEFETTVTEFAALYQSLLTELKESK